ncbi:bifunctional tRNA (mnm(5)s(2)U34)-methyltransferase/FAD-dependent cmnm(5)s(2)U34 oxidoreductase [Novipirellula aureliae]|uniref:Bifunctional tRNA (Mnm(5)s(2)U34)-methyltransferase/FAD-dependent cmnm(5)s(2)U34 oxidoreductase n=1 Tax=Novipirellula aureliae TaxID=2527966 RepID=A0A5C6E655_9BACT|nr:tRNA (5-methylaminomethyl-2-thiouridine)(34)-methyltransferase MnmD [Novipirellula aureliae]TWU42976.1 bifunctional tRNA (mnm(5)s(2)U34)-methyltransferase/FAD-dependent cmnm(5)s(2)U34 oxidoreductase [Novipirellula aureliae]
MNEDKKNARHRSTLPTDRDDLRIQVTDDTSYTLIRIGSDVTYHSSSGAMAETKHVYLGNSGIAARLRAGKASNVLEVGLGTGMSMLMTVDLAVQTDAPLDYVAIEWDLLSESILRGLKPETWLQDGSLANEYLSWRSRLGAAELPSTHTWHAGEKQRVTIHCIDAEQFNGTPEQFDGIYFDPFAPEVSPGLWELPVLERMFDVLKSGGTLVTYCVKRQVRDRLAAVGFSVQKSPGPPAGKREVLIAKKIR